MRVFELMAQLAELPAGAEVKIHMLKSLREIPVYDDGLRRIKFPVANVDFVKDDEVWLDGYYD